MPAVGECDSLIDAAHHMSPCVIGSNSHKGALRVGMHIAGHNKRKKNRTGVLWGDRGSLPIDFPINIIGLWRQISEIPGQIRRTCSTGLLDEIPSRETEQRIHQHSSICYGLREDTLVDTPGACGHTYLIGTGYSCGQSTGIDVEHPAGNRRTGSEAGPFCGFLCHISAEISCIF